VDIKEIQKQIDALQLAISDNNERRQHCDDPKMYREYGAIISGQKQALNKLVDLLAQAQALQNDSPDFDDDAPDFDPTPVAVPAKAKQQYAMTSVNNLALMLAEALKQHEIALELAHYALSISPLDCESLNVMFGFDFTYRGNHNELLVEALGLAPALGMPTSTSVGNAPAP
jgi:tetratricopeptide (TPR) repeat protein